MFGIKQVSWYFEIGKVSEEEPLPSITSNIQVKEVSAASDHVQISQLQKFVFDFNVSSLNNLILSQSIHFIFSLTHY